MAASAKIQSGELSAHMFKKALMEKHGVDIDSDPTLAADFYNILDVLSLLPSPLPLDSPESSRGNKPPSSCCRKISEKDDITGIVLTPTLITNDGFWRKYGSKPIKGSPYQRDYYRCRYGDCKAKRQVQQIQKDPNSPLLFQTTYFSRHTCQTASNDTHYSTSMIQFDSQVPNVTNWDLPPLVTADHQEGIIHNTIPVRNDDHESWLNPITPFNDMRHEDESWLNPIIPFNDMKHEDESWLNFTFPFNDMKDEDGSWLNPIISFNGMKDEDEFSLNPTVHGNNMNDDVDGSSLNSVLGNGMDDDHDQYLSNTDG